jgi:hypothetical protein
MQVFTTLFLNSGSSFGIRKSIKTLLRTAGPVLVVLAVLLIGFLAYVYLSTLQVLFADSLAT